MRAHAARLIREAMASLEGLPCGGIGKDGPSAGQLADLVEDTGTWWNDDVTYHLAQRAWRMLEAALLAEMEGRA